MKVEPSSARRTFAVGSGGAGLARAVCEFTGPGRTRTFHSLSLFRLFRLAERRTMRYWSQYVVLYGAYFNLLFLFFSPTTFEVSWKWRQERKVANNSVAGLFLAFVWLVLVGSYSSMVAMIVCYFD